MGQGDEAKTRDDPLVEIQERGEIFFFYRPRVGRMEARGVDDVQRLYVVLRPESGERAVEEKQDPDSGKEGSKKEAKDAGDGGGSSSSAGGSGGSVGGHGAKEVNIEKVPLLRFIVMGRKMLPDPSKRSQPFWGFVELVTTSTDDIKTSLEAEATGTSLRHELWAKACIVSSVTSQSRRVSTTPTYKLELPREGKTHDPQESLYIELEGSFLIQIKNPAQHSGSGGFRGLQSKRKAQFPAHLQAQLGHLRFAPADPPDFLNYEGCEFLLIAASDDIEEELGLELQGEIVEEEEAGGDEAECKCSDLVKTFGEGVDTKPLFQGAWD